MLKCGRYKVLLKHGLTCESWRSTLDPASARPRGSSSWAFGLDTLRGEGKREALWSTLEGARSCATGNSAPVVA